MDSKTMLGKQRYEQFNDDHEIIKNLIEVGNELRYAHNSLNYITDDLLIDSYIYEIQALNKKYQYYIKLCKERGLIAEGFRKCI